MRSLILVPLLALPLAADEDRGALPVLAVAELRAYEVPVPAVAPGAPPRATLGLLLEEAESAAGAIVRTVPSGSAAEKAGVRPGDTLLAVGEAPVQDTESLNAALGDRKPGDVVELRVSRASESQVLEAEVSELSETSPLGLRFSTRAGDELVVARVGSGSPAEKAGIKRGVAVTAVDGAPVRTREELLAALRAADGRKARVELRREGGEHRLSATLQERRGRGGFGLRRFTGDRFRLAVVLVEFTDRSMNAGFGAADYERMLFSRNEYFRTPSGEPAFGSLRDFYLENSCGKLTVEGRCLAPVKVPGEWADYDRRRMGPGFGGGSTERPTSLFADAIAALAARDGAAALEPFDGVVFIYAGAMQSRRGSSLWPHRSNVRAGGSSKPYYVVSEGGDRFGAIGVHCHEFGHMVGLPDQYGFGHRTGVGRFCTMAIGHQGGGASLTARPFQLCPWCKAQLDWLTPRVVDPRVPQRVRLRPVEGSTTECVKIPITPDAREYLLLEVRSRTGFDSDFPRPGLLVWRFGERGQGTRSQTGMSLDLVEAHGLDVFDASLREPDGVPWPWGGKRHYTPVTWPSSASAAPGAFEVHLTDIELEADGAVTFDLGLASRSRATVKAEPPPEGTVPEVEEAVDPITGETMKFRNRPRSPRIKVLPPAEDGGPK